jgi:putative nucleotidyltransferase with HDIG domain
VLMQLGGLAGMERGALYLRIPPGTPRRSDQLPEHFEISAATGEFERYIEAGRNEEVLPAPLVASLHEAYLHKQHLFRDDHYVLHFVDSQHGESLLYVGDAWNLSPMDFKLVELFCTNVSIAYENLHLNQELHDAQLEMICLLAGAAETRSRETAAHVKRVGLIAEALALALGMEAREAELLRHAAPLHDVGKIGIPDAVLNKPGRHDEAEATVMRTHADLGAQMLAESRRPVLRLAAEIARSHHENWDGSGYPQGLAGAAIPLPGRIVAVADVWDALGSVRCYKPAWDGAAIRAHFTEQRGRKFDPTVVDALFAHWNTLEEIRRRFPDPA